MKYFQICKVGQVCLKSVEIWLMKDLKFANESLLFGSVHKVMNRDQNTEVLWGESQ